MMIVREACLEDFESSFARPPREQSSVVQHVARPDLARQAKLRLPRHSRESQMLAEVFSRAHRVAAEARVDAARAKLAGEGKEPFDGPGPGRARDEEERGARPVHHAWRAARGPAWRSGKSARQARSSSRSSMQRKCPRGQRLLPKKEQGEHSTPAKSAE